MSSSAQQRDELYETLLTINRQAFAEHAFEVAYHTLCATVWRARDLGNMSLLRTLQQEAEKQGKYIDDAYPAHRLSSSSASTRGHESVYSALQREIGAHIQVHESQGLLEDLKRQREQG